MRPPPSCLAFLVACAVLPAQGLTRWESGDRIVFVGNTFAERMQMFSNFETMLTIALADAGLTFRNLGWSADTLSLKPRPHAFGTEEEHLQAQKADVIFACYGMNESFTGTAGLAQYRADWNEFLSRTKTARYNRGREREVIIEKERRFPGIEDGRDDDRPVRVVMVSPIAHEDLGRPLPDPTEHNRNLERYTEAMREIAAAHDVTFVDLFTPSREWMRTHQDQPLTFNGIHLTAFGDWVVGRMMMEALGFESLQNEPDSARADDLREVINEKNRMWFHRWRAVNGFYIYGGRKEPFGVHNFPEEMAALESLIVEMEQRIRTTSRSVGAGWSALPAPRGADR